MPRVDVTAKVGFVYDGVPRPEGAVFDCDLGDANILRDIGKVEFEGTAEEPAIEAPPSKPKAKRYQRKDLVAED